MHSSRRMKLVIKTGQAGRVIEDMPVIDGDHTTGVVPGAHTSPDKSEPA